MKRMACRVGHLSFKLVIGLIVLACVMAGLVGLVLPIVPGVIFLALAAFIGARHFPEAERWAWEKARQSPTLGRYVDGARRFSFSRISLSRLTPGQRLWFGLLLGARALVDGAALIAAGFARVARRAGAMASRGRY